MDRGKGQHMPLISLFTLDRRVSLARESLSIELANCGPIAKFKLQIAEIINFV